MLAARRARAVARARRTRLAVARTGARAPRGRLVSVAARGPRQGDRRRLARQPRARSRAGAAAPGAGEGVVRLGLRRLGDRARRRRRTPAGARSPELLIENGAPPTLFSAAMLGQLDLVKAFLATVPGGQRMRGPHSISLLTHAQSRRPAGRLGSHISGVARRRRSAVERRADHRSGSRAARRALHLRRPPARQLQGGDDAEAGGDRARRRAAAELHAPRRPRVPPRGAPQVRIRFEREAGKISALTILDPDLIVRARKVG